MSHTQGEFRFAFFTAKYTESCRFYQDQLELDLAHSWDRNENDKGSLFKAGQGLIEVLSLPIEESYQIEGLDYRPPQGAFMVLKVEDIDELYEKYQANGVSFKQEIVNQAWGHRSFSVLDPNGLVLLFIQDQF